MFMNLVILVFLQLVDVSRTFQLRLSNHNVVVSKLLCMSSKNENNVLTKSLFILTEYFGNMFGSASRYVTISGPQMYGWARLLQTAIERNQSVHYDPYTRGALLSASYKQHLLTWFHPLQNLWRKRDSNPRPKTSALNWRLRPLGHLAMHDTDVADGFIVNGYTASQATSQDVKLTKRVHLRWLTERLAGWDALWPIIDWS